MRLGKEKAGDNGKDRVRSTKSKAGGINLKLKTDN
jgi:hypothetical protein